MSIIEDYFRHKADETVDYPILRCVDAAKTRPEVKRIAIEVLRSRDALGFKPAKIYVHFLDENGRDVQPNQQEDWDDALNTHLIKRRIPTISVENEKVRFALGLRATFQTPETRFGDGYFNSVLVHHIENSALASHPQVKEVLKYVYKNGVDPSTPSYAECRDQIDAAIGERAHELVEDLGYAMPEAEQILAAAVAQYLDERFSVTNRKLMRLL